MHSSKTGNAIHEQDRHSSRGIYGGRKRKANDDKIFEMLKIMKKRNTGMCGKTNPCIPESPSKRHK